MFGFRVGHTGESVIFVVQIVWEKFRPSCISCSYFLGYERLNKLVSGPADGLTWMLDRWF